MPTSLNMYASSHHTYAYIGDMPDPFATNMSLSRRRWTGILGSRHTNVCWTNNPFRLAIQRSVVVLQLTKPGRSFFPLVLIFTHDAYVYIYTHFSIYVYVAAIDLLSNRKAGKSGDRNSNPRIFPMVLRVFVGSFRPETRQFREIGSGIACIDRKAALFSFSRSNGG